MAYVDKAYIRSATKHQYIKDLIDDINSIVVDEAITEAEEIINQVTGQSFTLLESNRIILNGNGDTILMVPYKIESITDLLINNSSVANFTSGTYQIELLDDLTFPIGSKNIIIEGTFGWSTIPSAIKITMRKLVECLILTEADTQTQLAYFSAYKSQSEDKSSYSMKDLNYKETIINSIISFINKLPYKSPSKGHWKIEVI